MLVRLKAVCAIIHYHKRDIWQIVIKFLFTKRHKGFYLFHEINSTLWFPSPVKVIKINKRIVLPNHYVNSFNKFYFKSDQSPKKVASIYMCSRDIGQVQFPLCWFTGPLPPPPHLPCCSTPSPMIASLTHTLQLTQYISNSLSYIRHSNYMDGVVQQGRHGGSARPPTNLPHFLLNHTLKVNKHTSYLSSITSDLMNFLELLFIIPDLLKSLYIIP